MKKKKMLASGATTAKSHKTTIAQMAAHVEKLVKEHKLKTKGSNRGGRAWHKSKTISIPPVKSLVTYLLALHEIAHVVYPKAHNGTRLEKEYRAWQWTLAHSLVRKLTPQACRGIHDRLNSYVEWAKNRQHRKVPPKLPAEDHSIWKLLAQLERVAAK